MRQSWLQNRIAGAVVLLAISLITYLIAFADGKVMGFIFTNATFYILLLLSLMWLWSIAKFLKQIQSPSLWKEHCTGLLVALACAALVFISVKPAFRILADETNLQSVSQSFLYFKKAMVIKNMAFCNGSLKLLGDIIPYPPLLTPFLCSVLHTLIGYSHRNIFVLNFILLFSTVFIVFTAARKFSLHFAVIAVIFLIAQPEIPLCFTSGGYEPTFLFFLILTLYLAHLYIQVPSESLFLLLFMTGMMTANTRPEAILLVSIIFVFLLVFRKLRISDISSNILYLSMAPLFIMPWMFQKLCFDAKFPGQFMGEPFNPRQVVGRFSLSYLFPNLKIAAITIFDFNFQHPYANILLIASLFLIPWLFIHIKRTASESSRCSVILATTVVLAHFILLMLFFAGEFNSPGTYRLFATMLIYSSLICAYFISVRIRQQFWGIAIAAVVFLAYYPVAIRAPVDNRIPLTFGTRFVWDFIEREHVRQTDLIIARVPVSFGIMNIGAVDFEYANAEWKYLKMWEKAGLFGKIYVVQECDRRTGAVDSSTALPKDNDCTLTPLDRIMITDNQSIVISRLRTAGERTD